MISKRVLEILGLKLNVYGLDEYKALPEYTPLSAMFFCHGFGQNQEILEEHCQTICQLNETRDRNDRYLIIISIDHPNVGTRKSYDEEPFPKPGSFKHQHVVFKLFSNALSTAHDISSIIESFDIFAFGTKSNSFVEKWGVIGHSMGGITAELVPAFNSKVSTVIMISSSLRCDWWSTLFAKSFGLETEFYAHAKFREVMLGSIEDKIPKLQNVNLLMLFGDKDRCIPQSHILNTVNELRKIHNGKEGYDWKYVILPGSKHDIGRGYIIETMKWTKKWMLSKPIMMEASL